MAQNHIWWKEAVFYQVWPASFKDSNGDGIGDIRGVISKLDYLKSLGVDAIWMSPMYDSPRNDMGYDVRDYEAVDADFGSLQDMDDLIKGLHDRGMRLLLDLVVNHTSDQHKWFQASKQSRDNEYSDYYIWRDPKMVDGKKTEPNNWASVFGGSAWKYVPARDQYYLHLFHETQPDVNWELEKVRRDMYQTSIRFWLDRGVDGFRVDAVIVYSKDQTFPDAEVRDPKAQYHGPNWTAIADGPKMHEWLAEQRKEALDPYGSDIVLVGEAGNTSTEDTVLRYIDPQNRELDMIFDMSVVFAGDGFDDVTDETTAFNLAKFRQGWTKPQTRISQNGCWSTVFLENHDNPRSVDKFGSTNPELRAESAKLLALLLTTLSGSLFIYQGQEIGMSGVPRSWPMSEWRDEPVIEYIRAIEKTSKEKAMRVFESRGRDHSRTPVQWSAEANGGFSTGKPWMRVNENYAQAINVVDQEADANSVLNYWKTVVLFRKRYPEFFVYGHTRFVDVENTKVLFYVKRAAGDSGEQRGDNGVLVVLNFTDEILPLQMPVEIEYEQLGELLMATGDVKQATRLRPREGRVYRLK